MLSGIANYYLEAGQGIEYVADHLGHKNIQNTRIYAQITTSLRQEVFAKLEHHPNTTLLFSIAIAVAVRVDC